MLVTCPAGGRVAAHIDNTRSRRFDLAQPAWRLGLVAVVAGTRRTNRASKEGHGGEGESSGYDKDDQLGLTIERPQSDFNQTKVQTDLRRL